MQHGNDNGPDLQRVWYGVASAFCALFVGIGLCRFAYTPLLPAVIGAGWFTPGEAAYLGAANLAGYLAGALGGRHAAQRLGTVSTIRVMMLVATATFLASSVPVSFLWFGLWRFASGVAGGALMVLAATSVLPTVPAHRRGFAGGVIFAGVGLGIAVSGTLVPALLGLGLWECWIALGAVSGVLTAVTWAGWPRSPDAEDTQKTTSDEGRPSAAGLKALYAAYALNAIGLVPHMVFLVDYVARGLGQGIAAGGAYWALFGVGAVAGPLIAGSVADRIGFSATLRGAFLLQAAGVLLILQGSQPIFLALSCLVVGAAVPGVVPLVLGRIVDLLPTQPGAVRRAWSRATAAFAIGQAAGGYGYSFMFAESGGRYAPMFITATAALTLALLIDFAAASTRRNHPSKKGA